MPNYSSETIITTSCSTNPVLSPVAYIQDFIFWPRHRRSMFGRWAFSVAGPAWPGTPYKLQLYSLSSWSVAFMCTVFVVTWMNTFLFSFYYTQRIGALRLAYALYAPINLLLTLTNAHWHWGINLTQSDLYYPVGNLSHLLRLLSLWDTVHDNSEVYKSIYTLGTPLYSVYIDIGLGIYTRAAFPLPPRRVSA